MRRRRRHPICRCDLGRRDDRKIAKTARDGRKAIVMGEGLQVRKNIENPLIRHRHSHLQRLMKP
jgi:hypothetical protein